MGDLFAAGGKRLRPALVLLAGRLGRLSESHYHAAAAVELTHAATLVHDDVIDNSAVRRGRPTVAAALGDAPAIVVGDYYFAKAYQQAALTHDPAVVGAIAGAVMTICRGELAQNRARFHYRPSLAEYRARIEAKTAALLAASAWVGGRLAGLPAVQQEALRLYGTELGLAFQIADDVLDYTAGEAELGKPVGHDLLEGHATLPLLLADLPETLPEDTPLLAERVAEVVAAVRASEGPERALAEARKHAESARNHLSGLPEGPARESLERLTDYVVERKL
jgi:geranylgeranyl pyrophosphate synthase